MLEGRRTFCVMASRTFPRDRVARQRAALYSTMTERQALGRHAAESATSLAFLARAMQKRDERYFSRFVAGGPPSRLKADDRDYLAKFFNVAQHELGMPEARAPQ